MFGVPERIRRYEEIQVDAEGRIPYGSAIQVAEDLQARLRPVCERIEIAGSLRRKRPTVKDIELLCIPKVESLNNLLGEPVFHRNFLDELLEHLLTCNYQEGDTLVSGGLLSRRPNKTGSFTWGSLNRYAIHSPTQIPVDIFIADEENWGMSLVIRTGGADFNKSMMTRFQKLGMKGTVHQGIVGKNGETINCPNEETVFRHLEWDYLKPEER